ncbi:MAG: trypsin-like serine protease [Pseudobdellovibrionaceae bacterium]
MVAVLTAFSAFAIVGGQPAAGSTAEDYAVLVRVGQRDLNVEDKALSVASKYYYCGGVMITKNMVLTAASCLKSGGYSVTGNQRHWADLGPISSSPNQRSQKFIDVVFGPRFEFSKSKTIDAKSYIVHPQYMGSNNTKSDVYKNVDLALIELTEDKPDSTIIAKLAKSSAAYKLPLNATALGYGDSDFTNKSTTASPAELHFADIDLDQYQGANNVFVYYPSKHGVNSPSLVSMDAGGPVFMNAGKDGSTPLLLGLAMGCVIQYSLNQPIPDYTEKDRCRSQNIFLNINKHVDWIVKTLSYISGGQQHLELFDDSEIPKASSDVNNQSYQKAARTYPPSVAGYPQKSPQPNSNSGHYTYMPGRPGQAPVYLYNPNNHKSPSAPRVTNQNSSSNSPTLDGLY